MEGGRAVTVTLHEDMANFWQDSTADMGCTNTAIQWSDRVAAFVDAWLEEVGADGSNDKFINPGSSNPNWADTQYSHRTVRVFRLKFTLEDAIGFPSMFV